MVLGFFGIAVVGQAIRGASQSSLLSWVSFFPISERLNIFTAGCLLALMAMPTIFTLSEDALRNVPRGFKEASYALGANRLQTIARVLVPASLSGIVSAILLGLGRVIGETMVVLLCAGNRIEIPDFTQGLGAILPAGPHHDWNHRAGNGRGGARQHALPRAFHGRPGPLHHHPGINYPAQKFVTVTG